MEEDGARGGEVGVVGAWGDVSMRTSTSTRADGTSGARGSGRDGDVGGTGEEGAQRTGVEHVFPGREFVGEDGGRDGDVAEVVVEDRAAGLLPVRAEGGGGVGALGECGDEGGEGGVVREAELGVALWAGWGVCGVGRVGVESWVSWVRGRKRERGGAHPEGDAAAFTQDAGCLGPHLRPVEPVRGLRCVEGVRECVSYVTWVQFGAERERGRGGAYRLRAGRRRRL